MASINNNINSKTLITNNKNQSNQAKTQTANKTAAKKTGVKTVSSIIDDLKTGKTTTASATNNLRSIGATVTQVNVGTKTVLTIKTGEKVYTVTTNSSKVGKNNAVTVTEKTAPKSNKKTVADIVNDLKNGKTNVVKATSDLKLLGATIIQNKGNNKNIITIKEKTGKVYTITTNSTMQVTNDSKSSGINSVKNSSLTTTQQVKSIQEVQYEEFVTEYEKMMQENPVEPKNFDLSYSQEKVIGSESIYKKIENYTDKQYQDALYDMFCLTDEDFQPFTIPNDVTAGDVQEYILSKCIANISGDNLCKSYEKDYNIDRKQHLDMMSLNSSWYKENMDDIIKAANDAFCELADEKSKNSGKIKGATNKKKEENVTNLINEFKNAFNAKLKEKLKTVKNPAPEPMSYEYDKKKANGLTEDEYRLKASLNNTAAALQEFVKSQGEFYVDLYGTGQPMTATEAITHLLEMSKDANVKELQKQIKDLERQETTGPRRAPGDQQLGSDGSSILEETNREYEAETNTTYINYTWNTGSYNNLLLRNEFLNGVYAQNGFISGGGAGGGRAVGSSASQTNQIQKASHANAKKDLNALEIADRAFMVVDSTEVFGELMDAGIVSKKLLGDLTKYGAVTCVLDVVGSVIDTALFLKDANKTGVDYASLGLSWASTACSVASAICYATGVAAPVGLALTAASILLGLGCDTVAAG